jgi:hypothetical protein
VISARFFPSAQLDRINRFEIPKGVMNNLLKPTFLGLLVLSIFPTFDAMSASNSSMPKELEGVWVTTKEENLGGRAGGDLLKSDQKSNLCISLKKNAFAPHSFEGVLVLNGNAMATWDGKCAVYGGFTGSNGKYSTKWKCAGEHGTNSGKVSFELSRKDADTSLIATTTFSKGGSFTNVYDEKCK